MSVNCHYDQAGHLYGEWHGRVAVRSVASVSWPSFGHDKGPDSFKQESPVFRSYHPYRGSWLDF